MRRQPGTAFQLAYSRCTGGGEPLTPAQLGRRLSESFQRLAPPQRPGLQPVGRALVNMPTIFYAGQPATMDVAVPVPGAEVRISAKAAYTWNFGDGSRTTVDVPGAPYPNKDVTHTYRQSGERRITLTTTWRGSYTVAGDGPYPISGVVRQVSRPLDLQVVTARAQLVAGDD